MMNFGLKMMDFVLKMLSLCCFGNSMGTALKQSGETFNRPTDTCIDPANECV